MPEDSLFLMSLINSEFDLSFLLKILFIDFAVDRILPPIIIYINK